jgi:hypothetical protein
LFKLKYQGPKLPKYTPVQVKMPLERVTEKFKILINAFKKRNDDLLNKVITDCKSEFLTENNWVN